MPGNRRRVATTLQLERQLWDADVDVVVGMDEVGRGSWAGPLTVAAVVADPDRPISQVQDSKKLTPAVREKLHDRIIGWARAVCIAHATVEECVQLGMSVAQRLAAKRALDGIALSVDHVLVDGPWDFVTPKPDHSISTEPAGCSDSNPKNPIALKLDLDDLEMANQAKQDSFVSSGVCVSQSSVVANGDLKARFHDMGDQADAPAVTTVVRGDTKSLTIAAASIVAKVTRDRIMVAAAKRYPAYRFASNKGYRCPHHVSALQTWGISDFHRRNWVFVNKLCPPTTDPPQAVSGTVNP